MKVGFVGLGLMGLPIARNMVEAGHAVTIQSTRAESVAELTAMGATQATTFRELCAEAEIICSCRVSPKQSIETFAGGEGAINFAARGTVCIDFATVDPATSRQIGSSLAAAGIGFLDAPVSGGPDGAKARTLSVMVGGNEADLSKARPLLEDVAGYIFHMGGVGNGVATKLCNNLITGTLHVLIAEAMVLGTKAGINPRRLYEVLHSSTAQGRTLERVVPNHFLPRNFAPASALSMIIKDLDCVLAMGKSLDVRLLLPALAQQCYIEAEGHGYGAEDLSAVIRPMEKIAGITVGPA